MKLKRLLLKILPQTIAYAHCDIPCGIYDPHAAQMAAHTVIRMTNLINDLRASSDNAPFEERKKIISPPQNTSTPRPHRPKIAFLIFFAEVVVY